MLPILLSNRVIKESNGCLSSFIWSKRKPRLKFSNPHLSSSIRGLDLANVKLYQLACQLRFVVEWLKEDPKSIWFDLECSQSNCSLQNVLFVHNSKSIRALCNSPSNIRNTLKAWLIIHRLEGRTDASSLLTPILNNPEFMPSFTDSGFKLWHPFGMTMLGCDLFVEGSLMSFDYLVIKYNLPQGQCLKVLHFPLTTHCWLWKDHSEPTVTKSDHILFF